MHILHITDGIPPRTLGGSGQIVLETARGLARLGHTVSLLTAGTDGEFPSLRDGIAFFTVSPRSQVTAHYRSVFSRKRGKEVAAIVAAVQPDVIHMHTVAWQCGYTWIGRSARRGVPIVATAHDVMHVACGRVTGEEPRLWRHDLKRTGLAWNPLRTFCIRRALRRCRAILCVSDALHTYLASQGIANLETLRHGIDLDFWKEPCTRTEARERLNLPQGVPLFLLAGRMGVDKGSALITRTLPTEAHLLLAGEIFAPEFAPLGARSHILPRQNAAQMRTVYAACDAALVPSLCLDCFPTVALEAMACSRPVLATTMGGAKEAVVNGLTGWIRDPRDPDAWRQQMQWCAMNRDRLAEYGSAARRHMETHFALDRYLRDLLRVYDRTRGAGNPETDGSR